MVPHGFKVMAREKNWVPFVFEDAIHVIQHLNPPLVFRVPPEALEAGADNTTTYSADSRGGDDVDDSTPSKKLLLEFVSRGRGRVLWQWGNLRGGTPAVFDPALGGYVTFFHTWLAYDDSGCISEALAGYRKSYFLGMVVFAARPPFAIQHMVHVPLVGPDMYTDPLKEFWQVIFPAGLEVTQDAFIISYGQLDRTTQLVHFDRRQLESELQPPLPADWSGTSRHECQVW